MYSYFRTILILSVLLVLYSAANADVFRTVFDTDTQYLIVEMLDDNLAHLEFSVRGKQPSTDKPLYTTPMVMKKDYSGPSSFFIDGNIIETSAMRLEITKNDNQICVRFIDKMKANERLTTVCPVNLEQALKGLDIEPGKIENITGLGQNLSQLASGIADRDRISQGVAREASYSNNLPLGNGFEGLANGGMVGYVQIPVYYALGSDNLNYALFMDNDYWQQWDFTRNWWQARMYGDQLRLYFMTGFDLPDLHAEFMQLTGPPPTSERQSFGLWVSELGYEQN
jgi:alpha-glucosidase (family GH31 glycosyl hydrolase)